MQHRLESASRKFVAGLPHLQCRCKLMSYFVAESIFAWHCNDEKRKDGLPISFLVKDIYDIETAIVIALRKWFKERRRYPFIKDIEKAITTCTLRLLSCLAGQEVIFIYPFC